MTRGVRAQRARALAFVRTFHAPRDRRPLDQCSARLTWCTRCVDALVNSDSALGFRVRARSALTMDARCHAFPALADSGSADNGKVRALKQRMDTAR